MASSIVRQAARDMDAGMANVMPDSWLGHARLKIFDSELSTNEQDIAISLSQKLLDKGSVSSAEKAALAAMKAVKNRN